MVRESNPKMAEARSQSKAVTVLAHPQEQRGIEARVTYARKLQAAPTYPRQRCPEKDRLGHLENWTRKVSPRQCSWSQQ